MKVFRFKPRKKPILTKKIVDYILEEMSKAKSEQALNVTLDLGISIGCILLKHKHVLFPDGQKLGVEKLLEANNPRSIYYVRKNSLFELSLHHERKFYKLVPVSNETAPTLEISGIHMHRVKGVTPWRDSQNKVNALNPSRNQEVLDIGTGLGYTAIIAQQITQTTLITIEKDINVLKMAEYNPWSHKLSHPSIKILLGDASQVIKEFPDEKFHRVLHDPPRFSLAGELYSLNFYREIYRVLRRKGKLFHYTGEPRKRGRGSVIVKGVSKRLREAGFRIRWDERNRGFLAVKP